MWAGRTEYLSQRSHQAPLTADRCRTITSLQEPDLVSSVDGVDRSFVLGFCIRRKMLTQSSSSLQAFSPLYSGSHLSCKSLRCSSPEPMIDDLSSSSAINCELRTRGVSRKGSASVLHGQPSLWGPVAAPAWAWARLGVHLKKGIWERFPCSASFAWGHLSKRARALGEPEIIMLWNR